MNGVNLEAGSFLIYGIISAQSVVSKHNNSRAAQHFVSKHVSKLLTDSLCRKTFITEAEELLFANVI